MEDREFRHGASSAPPAGGQRGPTVDPLTPSRTPGARLGETPRHGHDSHHRDESTPGLLRGLAHDVATLVRTEGELIRTEMGEKLRGARDGIASMGAGAAILNAGLFTLLISGVLALDLWIERLWLSALIVGALVTLLGVALLMGGKRKLEADNLKPERSMRSLEKDADLARAEKRRML